MNCPQCDGEVRISFQGYWCRDCGETWDFIAPDNREVVS